MPRKDLSKFVNFRIPSEPTKYKAPGYIFLAWCVASMCYSIHSNHELATDLIHEPGVLGVNTVRMVWKRRGIDLLNTL